MGQIEDKIIRATNTMGKPITGKVILVFTDALASGINNYTQVTLLSVEDESGRVHSVYPRDLMETVKA